MTTRERPIIFSAPMVRAILDGRKTQTRRTIRRGQVFRILPGSDLDAEERRAINSEPFHWERGSKSHPTLAQLLECCPYGVAGDRLYVKENAWIAPPNFGDRDLTTHTDKNGERRCVTYDADMNEDARRCAKDYGLRMRPSILMPRWASRITLEVVAVRVERLSAISEKDVRAEGFGSPVTRDCKAWAFIDRFRQLNKLAPDADPWVWVVAFKRVEAKS